MTRERFAASSSVEDPDNESQFLTRGHLVNWKKAIKYLPTRGLGDKEGEKLERGLKEPDEKGWGPSPPKPGVGKGG